MCLFIFLQLEALLLWGQCKKIGAIIQVVITQCQMQKCLPEATLTVNFTLETTEN